jgi:murein L,D-transpeptidase YafK
MKLLTLVILIIGLIIYRFYPYSPMPDNIAIEKIIVDKSERKLMVYADGSVIKTFTIALGDQPIGPKEKKDDEKTPEGEYIINGKLGEGVSGFYKNLGVSYPSTKDKLNARQKGFSTGGDIKIHGLKNGLGFIGRFQSWMDWTDGCMAVTNEEMDDLYRHVKIGTPIIINP